MALYSGYDSFTPDPGEWTDCECGGCGAKMNVKRDCEGPTSYVMAMGKSTRKYDHFTCPNSGKEWHTQIIKLKEEIKDTVSVKLKKVLQSEIDEMMAENCDNDTTSDVIGGFPVVQQNCLGCDKPLTVENAWMTDGCPCNSELGVNSLNETRWRLLMQLQQQQSKELTAAKTEMNRFYKNY